MALSEDLWRGMCLRWAFDVRRMDCDVESGKGKGKGKEIDDEPDHKNDDHFIRKRQGSLRAFDKNKRYLSCSSYDQLGMVVPFAGTGKTPQSTIEV
ncbi:hypothetical protein H2248_000006 [Termitomyces sp. 'cryptogamus']|nr:hypothetical protein H2248_000006 [Termitomyces sp. 'cryptogamus']